MYLNTSFPGSRSKMANAIITFTDTFTLPKVAKFLYVVKITYSKCKDTLSLVSYYLAAQLLHMSYCLPCVRFVKPCIECNTFNTIYSWSLGIIQCIWLILSRRFASCPEPPMRLVPTQALAVRPVLIQ